MNIKECKEMQGDLPVLDLDVKVVSVGKRKTGEGEFGEWSFQDIQVKDSSGEIWVKCQNKDDLSSLRAKYITLSCYKSDKHGWVGLTTLDDEYNDKITRKLKMTKTGQITIPGDQPELKETEETKEISNRGYWDEKLELDKQRRQDDIEKQTIICRQHAVTTATTVLSTAKTKGTVPEIACEIIDLAEILVQYTRWGRTKITVNKEVKNGDNI